MENIVKNAIEEYQCIGCVSGGDVSCFEDNTIGGCGCGNHRAGTMGTGIGSFFLGLPHGFNRLGHQTDLKPIIFEKFSDSEWTYDMWNIPVWKHLNKEGHTLVRGMMPRRNEPFLHIFLEDCINEINCLEISHSDIDGMD